MPFVLCMTGLAVLLVSGCKKKSESPVAPTPARPGVSSVVERMADPEYVKQLDAQGEERTRLVKRLNGATNDVERAAAAKELEANRQRTMAIVRERMKKTDKEISK